MLKMDSLRLAIVCITFSLVKDVSVDSILMELIAPRNPHLLQIGLINQHSYPGEEHRVTTEDGYHLTIHRILGSPRSNNTGNKKVVYLQHGLIASSDVWVLRGPDKDLAFLLADAGYDVWLGNTRGNTYCRSHERLSPLDQDFWKFSYHEYAIYDMKSIVDYILQHTGQKKLSYIGHSMGTTMSYVLLAVKPEYNEKFNLVVSYAPVAFWNHGVTRGLRFVLDRFDGVQALLTKYGIFNIAPQTTSTTVLGRTLCHDGAISQSICAAILFTLSGIDPGQLNTTLLPTFMGHIPAGSSREAFYHYYQNVVSGQFQYFDYGPLGNFARYRQITPPPYNVSSITAPFALFYGINDVFVTPPNVMEIYKRLQNVVALVEVPYKYFTHVDFTWAIDAKSLLYDRTMELLSQF